MVIPWDTKCDSFLRLHAGDAGNVIAKLGRFTGGVCTMAMVHWTIGTLHLMEYLAPKCLLDGKFGSFRESWLMVYVCVEGSYG
jgi:hypothetical protein